MDGRVISTQRFISNLIPVNMFQDRLEGRLPPCWSKYMAFAKPVDASLSGGQAGKQVYPAMAVLPMGWVSSVAVIQSIVRTLVFKESEVPIDSEVAKTQPLPAGDDLTVVYLDSFDQLREFNKGCDEVLSAGMSPPSSRCAPGCNCPSARPSG